MKKKSFLKLTFLIFICLPMNLICANPPSETKVQIQPKKPSTAYLIGKGLTGLASISWGIYRFKSNYAKAAAILHKSQTQQVILHAVKARTSGKKDFFLYGGLGVFVLYELITEIKKLQQHEL